MEEGAPSSARPYFELNYALMAKCGTTFKQAPLPRGPSECFVYLYKEWKQAMWCLTKAQLKVLAIKKRLLSCMCDIT